MADVTAPFLIQFTKVILFPHNHNRYSEKMRKKQKESLQ